MGHGGMRGLCGMVCLGFACGRGVRLLGAASVHRGGLPGFLLPCSGLDGRAEPDRLTGMSRDVPAALTGCYPPGAAGSGGVVLAGVQADAAFSRPWLSGVRQSPFPGRQRLSRLVSRPPPSSRCRRRRKRGILCRSVSSWRCGRIPGKDFRRASFPLRLQAYIPLFSRRLPDAALLPSLPHRPVQVQQFAGGSPYC